MALLIFYLLLALITSFLCSLAEASLLSTPMTYVQTHKGTASGGLGKLIDHKKHIDRSLSAILSLNTVAHTVGAAGVGAQANIVFGEAYFGVVSAVLTLLILVLTEIIPKTIGAKYWKSLAPSIGHLIGLMVWLTYPLVVLSAKLTRALASNQKEQTTSREELSALAEIGANEGIFQEKENKIIQNLIKLKNIRVTQIMTPRTVVTLANERMPLVEFLRNKDYLRFSRIPVFDHNPDAVVGYVLRQTVFENLAEDHNHLMLSDIKKQIVVVPHTKHVFSLWEMLLEKKEHIALVVDDYGGLDGIVTMEDIIETLVGFEILDEKDTITDMQQYARERWKQRQTKYQLLDASLSDNHPNPPNT